MMDERFTLSKKSPPPKSADARAASDDGECDRTPSVESSQDAKKINTKFNRKPLVCLIQSPSSSNFETRSPIRASDAALVNHMECTGGIDAPSSLSEDCSTK
jgi:hypothetical protein